MFTLRTIRAAFNGLYQLESLSVTFLDGEVLVTGRITGIGSRLGIRSEMRLHEDVHPNQVLSMEVI
ncbi:hypothetical protein AB0E08_03680 [Streptomyces sp. NPDC048281]|uniref:hypothetical protein n=1 Tax=Streptomyces sp. NPDC048281 TaxID=3154715 RepID=UPI00343FDBD8